MSISEFLILSVIIGLIAYSFLTIAILNGYNRCQFCMAFWICTVMTLGYAFSNGFTPILIPLPFAAVAISHFINK